MNKNLVVDEELAAEFAFGGVENYVIEALGSEYKDFDTKAIAYALVDADLAYYADNGDAYVKSDPEGFWAVVEQYQVVNH